MNLISAHRAGARESGELEGSIESLKYALSLPVDFIEFDVQRFADGVYFLAHDEGVEIDGESVAAGTITSETASEWGVEYVRLDECVDLLDAGMKAHVDFKFVSPASLADSESWEVEAAQLILRHLPPGDVILTTLEDESVRRLRGHFSSVYPDLLVGLSLGRNMEGHGVFRTLATRLTELFPSRRIRKCRANLVVCDRRLAKLTVARWARAKSMPLLVWTVDAPEELKYWLSRDRAWLVTTNRPRLALEIRDGDSGLGKSPDFAPPAQ